LEQILHGFEKTAVRWTPAIARDEGYCGKSARLYLHGSGGSYIIFGKLDSPQSDDNMPQAGRIMDFSESIILQEKKRDRRSPTGGPLDSGENPLTPENFLLLAGIFFIKIRENVG
jgi:hypothetical protein